MYARVVWTSNFIAFFIVSLRLIVWVSFGLPFYFSRFFQFFFEGYIFTICLQRLHIFNFSIDP